MSEGFTLHPQLETDTWPVTGWPVCQVRLMNDARWPWLILVPLLADARDLHDVPADRHGALFAEIDAASRALQDLYGAHKINVAALGNMVPQLHIHVIARQTADAAWPGPVWGVGEARPYPGDSAAAEIERLRAAFASSGLKA